MKAYISDQAQYELNPRDAAWAGAVAMAEARRILVETEPGEDSTHVSACRVYWTAPPTWARAEASLYAPCEYIMAASETLAAFTSAPDPAAYLAELQGRS